MPDTVAKQDIDSLDIDLLQDITLPPLFDGVDNRLFGPAWWSKDGEEMAVYQINLEESEKAGEIILEESYCMTTAINEMWESPLIKLSQHKWKHKL